MVKRKFLFLCLLLVLLSIAGVGASDADNITVEASADMSEGDIVSDVAVQAGNDTLDDVVGADEADSQNRLAVSDDENTILGLAFKDLQKLVDDTPEGGELSLDNNYYVASGGHAIKISKSITINGNNHILDACKDGRIVDIEADGISVVFKNIQFVNGKTGELQSGGAIMNDHASTSLTFDNCIFENNNVRGVDHWHIFKHGGAIYCEGNCNIFNCSFNNNYAVGKGSAIYCEGNCNISSSSFKENHVRWKGGAVYCEGELTIENSTFENNKVTKPVLWMDGLGGALYCEGNCNIFNSSFKENEAYYDGGAIYCEGNCNIFKSKFENNSAYNGESLKARCLGGAIRSEGLVSIDQCIFDGNNAENQGGAIYANGEIKITNSCFAGNSAKMAGAVYADTIYGAVSNSTFTSNKATSGDGSAIYINSKCDPEFDYCTFENNTCDGDGGAIYLDSSNTHLKLSNCTFNENKATVDGGAIFTKGKTSISDSNFTNNAATGSSSRGGAIRSEGFITADNSRFEKNYALNQGGAIYADGEMKMTSSRFAGNSAKMAGAVYADTISGVVKKLEFINNDASEGDGGAIYINSNSNPEFVSCRFEENHANNRGGAIYLNSVKSHLRVSYCTFIDNHADKKDYDSKAYVCLAGHSVFNYGYYDLIDMCWFGRNDPYFNEQFAEHKNSADDKNHNPSNYLKIGIKINETENIYVRNNYEVTVYFYACNGNPLVNDLLHSSGRFYGDAKFSHLKVDNGMTTDANITKQDCIIVGELDHQNVTLNLTAINKAQSNITIENLSIENNGIYVLCAVNPNPSSSPHYVIRNSENHIVREGDMTRLQDDPSCNEFIISEGNLTFNSYNLLIKNPEAWEYLASEYSQPFKIILRASVNITADNTVYGDPTTISIRADYDGVYNVSINGEITQMNVEKGICDKMDMLSVGEYRTHTIYTTPVDYVEFTYNEASFNVSKGDPRFKLNISSNEFNYGDEVLVIPKVRYNTTGNISYSLNNKKYATLSVQENLKLSLDAGSYLIDATYLGDCNYYPAKDSITIKINPARNNATVSVDDVTYGENTTIKVSADADGIYAVDVNGTIYNITVNNGTGNKKIKLNAGTYYANATFNNKNYNTTYKNAIFNVNKADVELNITVLDEVYPQDVEGVIHANRDGEYNLTIGDYKDIIVVKDGICYFNIGTLDAGSYEAIVSLNDNNYNPISNRTKFIVNASGTLFEIEVNTSEITYGESVTVTHTINDGATGNITYFLNDGTSVGVLPVNKNLTLPILPVGHYVITADYSGDRDFIPASDIAFFTINKAPNNVVITADNVTYGENTTIKVSADVDGIYTIDINGTTYNVTVNNGVGERTIALNAGSYYANATFNNDNYNTNSRDAVFSVDKADTMLSVYVPTTVYLQDVIGVVYSSVDGEYNVTIGDYSTTVLVENVFGEFNAGILNAGDYILTATYPGDLNHKANSTTARVYITRFAPNITLNVSDIDWGETEVITITSDIYGTVNVTVNNVTVTLDLDGTTKHLLAATLNAASDSEYKATLQLDNLNSGTYPVTAIFNGDDNIESIFLSSEFKVNALNATMDADAGDINVDDDETITVTLPDDATGTVTATVDGKNYTSTVENGTASITIPDLTAGEKTADIYYSGDGKYNPAEDTATFTVNKIETKMTIDTREDSDGTSTIIVNLPDDATGTVTVTVDGKDYNAAVENGKATINIQGLAPGKHEIAATYSGDDKYDPIQNKTSIVVKDNNTKHENKTTNNATPEKAKKTTDNAIADKKAIKTTDKEMLKATGNPIFALLLTLMTIGITTIRRF